MPSNPMTRAQIIDACNNLIGSTLTTTWTDTKINQLLDNALSEISEAVPYVMVDIYQIESRRGIATSTSPGNLVDATNAHFVSAAADVGKVVYNTADRTWAQIQSFTSTSQVGLTADIMAAGEGYEIYNKGCWNKYQINIEDSGDFLGIIGAVYPVDPHLMFAGAWDNMRNVKLLHQNKIAELDTWFVDNTKNTDAAKDVHLYLVRQHSLNVETDLAGETTAAGTAGATTIAVDGFTASGTYYKNSLFYFTTIDAVTMNSRLVYRLKADVTMAAGAGTLSFFPALECGVSDGDDIQFISSTLTPDLERILINILTGQILTAEGISLVNTAPVGGSAASNKMYEMGQDILKEARKQLKALIDVDLRANTIWAK